MKNNYLKLFFYISLGIIALSIIYPFLMKILFDSWAERGTVGDTYGALNTIFSGIALSGVIITLLLQKEDLENQKIEMQLQREEMINTRNEFLMTRSTNLVYNQLERFENSVKEFKILYLDNIYVGNEALLLLYNKTKKFTLLSDNEEQRLQKVKGIILNNLNIYGLNKENIENFAQNTHYSVQVLKQIILSPTLERKDQEDLKRIFFTNIGFIKMDVLKNISETISYALQYRKQIIEITLPKNNLSGLMDAEIFLDETLNFYSELKNER